MKKIKIKIKIKKLKIPLFLRPGLVWHKAIMIRFSRVYWDDPWCLEYSTIVNPENSNVIKCYGTELKFRKQILKTKIKKNPMPVNI